MAKHAVLIERHDTPNERAQYLLIPSTSPISKDAHYWARITNGGKGGSNRWQGPLREDGLPFLYDMNTAKYIAVEMTDVDKKQVAAGFPHVLFQKARKATSKSPIINSTQAEARLVWSQVKNGDDLSVLLPSGGKSVTPPPPATMSAGTHSSGRSVDLTREDVRKLNEILGTPRLLTYDEMEELMRESTGITPAVAEVGEAPATTCAPKCAPPKEEAEIEEPIEETVEETVEEEPTLTAEEPAEPTTRPYINRMLPGDVQDFTLLDYAKSHQHNVLLYGPTQSGKTTLPMAYAQARDLRCVTISGDAAMDPNELFGHRTIHEGNDGYEENHVTQVIREGGVLIIDEINMFSQKILSPLFSLLDSRREIRIRDKGGEVVKAHPELLVVATMNPRYAGTMAMSEALLDRFQHRHEWDYDPAIEESLVPSASLRELFTKARKLGQIDTPLSTSLMLSFAEDVKGLGFTYARANIANRAIDSEERDAIRQLLDTYESRIVDELTGPKKPAAPKAQARPTVASTKSIEDWVKEAVAGQAAPWDF
jgi:hypothetical protein